MSRTTIATMSTLWNLGCSHVFFSASLFLCLASFCAYRLHEIGPWCVVIRESSQLTLCLRQTTTALAICPMDNQWSNSWSMSAWRNWSQCLPLCNTTTNTHQLLVPNLVNRLPHFFSAWTFATMRKSFLKYKFHVVRTPSFLATASYFSIMHYKLINFGSIPFIL